MAKRSSKKPLPKAATRVKKRTRVPELGRKSEAAATPATVFTRRAPRAAALVRETPETKRARQHQEWGGHAGGSPGALIVRLGCGCPVEEPQSHRDACPARADQIRRWHVLGRVGSALRRGEPISEGDRAVCDTTLVSLVRGLGFEAPYEGREPVRAKRCELDPGAWDLVFARGFGPELRWTLAALLGASPDTRALAGPLLYTMAKERGWSALGELLEEFAPLTAPPAREDAATHDPQWAAMGWLRPEA